MKISQLDFIVKTINNTNNTFKVYYKEKHSDKLLEKEYKYNQLYSCPHCGSKAELVISEYAGYPLVIIKCTNNKCNSKMINSVAPELNNTNTNLTLSEALDSIVKAWNRRITDKKASAKYIL